MQSFLKQHFALMTIVFAIISFSFSGCENPGAGNSPSASATAKALPPSALRFHRPKKLKAAVTRMRQIHDVIASSEALPEPIKYQVKEVIHGTGTSGHSHYYLHDPESSDHDGDDHDEEEHDDDGHETTGEEIHDVTIDPFIEIKDLSKWLPKLASDSNLDESDWTKVNEVSKQLTPILIEIVDQSSDNEERRAGYQEQAKAIASQLVTLEDLTK